MARLRKNVEPETEQPPTIQPEPVSLPTGWWPEGTIAKLDARIAELEDALARAALEIHGRHMTFSKSIEKCGNATCQRNLRLLPPRPWAFEVDPYAEERRKEAEWRKQQQEKNQ